MQAKNEISEELRGLSTNGLLPAASQMVPYTVPVGYFDGFSARVFAILGRMNAAGMGPLPEAAGSLPEADGKAESLTPGLEKARSLTFTVPEGYFDGFAGGVLDRIKKGGLSQQSAERPDERGLALSENARTEITRLSPLLSGLERKAPYWLPEGYFEELSPLLTGLQQKHPYTAPEGYFSTLADNILAKTGHKTPQPAKVISFRPGRQSWWKYSAAAVAVGVILTIGWLRLHNSSGAHPMTEDVASGLIKVSDQDLQNYLDEHNDQATAVAEPLNTTTTLDINDNDIKSLLGEVPDGELKQYLEEQGGANDIATN
jgi:hypothetical protein